MIGKNSNNDQVSVLEELIKKMNEMDGSKFMKGSGMTITIAPRGNGQDENEGPSESCGMDEMESMDGMDPRLMEIIRSKKRMG